MSKEMEKIWVLGGKASGADKSIPWQVNMPNLSNSDKLILDLSTVPADMTIPRYEIRNYLRYMMMAKKTVYVVLSPKIEENRYLPEILPVYPRINEVKPCDFKTTNPLCISEIPEEIEAYCKYVENCSFFIDLIISTYLWKCLNPKFGWNMERYPFSQQIRYFEEVLTFELLNVSSQSIGLASEYRILNNERQCLCETGQIIFLPPPTKISSTEAIEVLVNSLVGMELKEDEPDWASKVKLPKLDELETQICKENEIIEKTTERIQNLTKEKNEIEKHKKLPGPTTSP